MRARQELVGESVFFALVLAGELAAIDTDLGVQRGRVFGNCPLSAAADIARNETLLAGHRKQTEAVELLVVVAVDTHGRELPGSSEEALGRYRRSRQHLDLREDSMAWQDMGLLVDGVAANCSHLDFVGCKLWKGALRAFDRSIGPRWRAWRADQEVCLFNGR